jgi:hypothetical protein
MTMLSNILNALYPQDPEDDSYVTRLVVNGEEVINSDQQATFEDLTVTDTVVCDDIRNSAGEPYSTNSSFGNIQFSGSVISTNNNTAIKITKDLIVGEDKFIVDAETGNTTTVGTLSARHLDLSSDPEVEAWKIPIYSATKRLQTSEIEYDPNEDEFLIGAKVDVANNFTVNTDKFIVDSLNGDITAAGQILRSSSITQTYSSNTDPTNAVRSILIQNTNTAATANLQVGLSFGISPLRTFSNAGGGGRCLFDMRLVRNNLSDSSMIFSAYNGSGTYADIATFSRVGSNFIGDFTTSLISQNSGKISIGTDSLKQGLFCINSRPSLTHVANTDPGDDSRGLSIVNSFSTDSGAEMAALSFEISPLTTFGSGGGKGRCLLDMKLVRDNYSDCSLIFSAYGNNSLYTDIFTLNKTNAIFNSSIRANITSTLPYNGVANTDPTDSTRSIFVHNISTSTAENRQAVLSFGVAPSNSFGAVGARCLFDMRLVRNSGSNCTMIFSAYDNASTYRDVAAFGRAGSSFTSPLNLLNNFTTPIISQIDNQISFGVNETDKRGLLTVNHVASNVFLNNSNPDDSVRLISIQNPSSANTVGLQTGLSFGLSPTNAFGVGVGGNRCLFDMRLARVSGSNSKMVFSTYSNTSYSDITSFASDLAEIMTNLTVGTEKQRQGSFTVNYPSATVFAPSTDPGNLARMMGIINSHSSITTRTAAILSFGITPQNAYGSSTGQGRCLFDMKLVRDNYSNSSMIFSSVDNTALYSDIVAFSKNSTTFYTPITSESRIYAPGFTSSGYNFANRNIPLNIGIDNAASGYVANTDPGDTRRVALFTHKNVGVNQAINLCFDISPEISFATGRCLGDLRFYRSTAGVSSGQFLFSGYNTANQYRDWLNIAENSSFPNGSLSVGSSTPATISSSGALTIANTTNATSTTTGSATFAGGIGAGGKSFIREATLDDRTTFSANNQYWYISEATSNWHGFRFSVPAGNTPRVYFGNLDGTTNTTIYAGGYVPFSGCHIAKNIGPALTSSDVGKLFKLDGTLHKPTEILNGYCNGRLCDQDMSKAVYGIICDANYLDQDGNDNGEVLLLSVGEGGCLVHDDSGTVNIECGDILVSRADGYARKLEDSEFTAQTIKYVVARARETYNGPSPYLLHVTVECG